MAITPELRQRIEETLNSQRVVLFMKGTRDFPMCGFSARTVALLQDAGADFRDVNILEDEELRQGLKEYSDWPTYPQLYVDGKLLGGCDIVSEMHETGELEKLVTGAAKA